MTRTEELEFLGWIYETLGEINVNNYHHEDVCDLNDKSVEVILAVKARMAALTPKPKKEPVLQEGWHYDRDGYCDNPARGY